MNANCNLYHESQNPDVSGSQSIFCSAGFAALLLGFSGHVRVGGDPGTDPELAG